MNVGALDYWTLPLAVAWDLALGEPPARAHPVVWIGTVARLLEQRAPTQGRVAPFLYGALIATVPPLAYATATRLVSRWCGRWRLVGLIVSVPLLKSTFAIRELRRAGEGVRAPLAAGDLVAARAGLRSLVSRDPAALDPCLVAAAAVESLAENLSDAVVAPLFYWALFGLPGAVAYRAVNTLDAMIGYRGRYEWFGKVAARLDDLLNIIPARLTALLLVAATALSGGDVRSAGATARRDARLTASPNAGWPMATMAGALGVELEKVGHYRLGAGGSRADAATIARADRLVTLAALGAAVLAFVARLGLRRRGAGRWAN
jgi:adenosylcobinamide-phosphate synthase